MAVEEWRNFPDMDGRSFSKYEVSSLGRIRNKKTVYVFSTLPNSTGYIRNEFFDDKGKSSKILAHAIVTRAFLGEPDSDDLTPDHINRDKTDNRVVNLRWATKKQQTANSDNSKCKPRGQPVIQYTMDMEEIKRWPTITAAAKELGISNASISTVCRRSRDHFRGFKWAYERHDLDGEIWKDYEPFNVQVSNMGRIKTPCSNIIYGSKTNNGYLTYGNPRKSVHVMVAETFLSNPEKKPQVNHKDKDGSNNKLENLEWATGSENMIHSHQTNSNADRYSTSKAVKQYDLTGKFIGEYKSIKEAARQTECSHESIRIVCTGLSGSTKGYVFKYNDDISSRSVIKHSKSIDRIDKSGNVIKTYDSVKLASLDLEIGYKSIYSVLIGKTKSGETKDGFRFQYH